MLLTSGRAKRVQALKLVDSMCFMSKSRCVASNGILPCVMWQHSKRWAFYWQGAFECPSAYVA